MQISRHDKKKKSRIGKTIYEKGNLLNRIMLNDSVHSKK